MQTDFKKPPDVLVRKGYRGSRTYKLFGQGLFYTVFIMKEFKRYFVVGESLSYYLKPSKSRSKEVPAILSVREKSGAVGPLLRCHKCSKLGHTANKCRNSKKFRYAREREVNEFTEVTEATEVMSF